MQQTLLLPEIHVFNPETFSAKEKVVVAHNSAHLHKSPGTTQGHTRQTCSCKMQPSGSNGQKPQR